MDWILFTSMIFTILIFFGCARTDISELEGTNDQQEEHQTVISSDSTRIGFVKIGTGLIPVVIVHGALNSSAHWIPVATAMAEHCTCYVMDRWGRGGSDTHSDYSIEREVEDIRAVLETAGPEAYLLGHSSGAIYTLETARQYPVAGLILYEPPLHAFHGRFVEEILPGISTADQEDRFDDVVNIFLRDEAGIPESELGRLMQTPQWDNMVALAPHSVQEWEELAKVGFPIHRFQTISVPTLLLTGSITKEHPSFATQALENSLPKVRTVTLAGQAHSGNRTAPDLVAKEVVQFIFEASKEAP